MPPEKSVADMKDWTSGPDSLTYKAPIPPTAVPTRPPIDAIGLFYQAMAPREGPDGPERTHSLPVPGTASSIPLCLAGRGGGNSTRRHHRPRGREVPEGCGCAGQILQGCPYVYVPYTIVYVPYTIRSTAGLVRGSHRGVHECTLWDRRSGVYRGTSLIRNSPPP